MTMKFCNIRILVVLGLLLSETNGAGETSVIIAKNSVWKYAVGSQYPDPLWNQPAYNDSTWPSGPGILGYGEAYISTTVPYGPDASNKYITTCFRQSFQLGQDSSLITALAFSVNYDDGFVAYLNGQEIARGSMPGGTVDFSTLASSHEGGIYETIDITQHKDQLVAGINLLAVEVHQTTPSSSDLVWDAELSYGTSQVQFVWSGAMTTTSASVKAKLTQDSLLVRLAVSLDSSFSAPLYSDYDTALTSENSRVVDLQISGLTPNQQYLYALEVGGVLDLQTKGKFHTFPAGAASFKFAFASCALTASNHQVFETILSENPLFFFHLGDFHYLNIGINDRNLFRQAYETVLASPNQSRLYRNVPIAYIWDDHDYGPNNSDSTAPGRLASRLTYQEYVPHYPLAFGPGDVSINQTFAIGRVKFIVCDSRSARSPAGAPDDSTKTVLGTLQKDWFKQELLDSKDNYPLMVWVNTFPWIGTTGDDAWNLYANERRELANFLKDNDIHNLCMISGDAHMLAIDNGTNSDYAGGGAGFPVMHAAALDQVGSLKGGPYSQGAFPGGGQFGMMTINDSGESLKVEWSGRNYLDEEIVSYSFTVPGNVGPACMAKSGDATADDTHTLGDLIAAVNYIFSRPGCSPLPLCWLSGLLCRGDWNGNGTITLGDVIWGVNYIFNRPGGPWVPVPSGICCLPLL
jgi:hypothetical protein